MRAAIRAAHYHYTGIGALNALAATLLISPIAKLTKQGLLMQTRRLVGYMCSPMPLCIFWHFSLDLLFVFLGITV